MKLAELLRLKEMLHKSLVLYRRLFLIYCSVNKPHLWSCVSEQMQTGKQSELLDFDKTRCRLEGSCIGNALSLLGWDNPELLQVQQS